MNSVRTVRIGTRGSDLALWQAREAARLIGAPTGIEIIRTSGDRFLDIPLQGRLEKGFFTREIEAALLAGEVDIAVHSLKDLPVEMPEGLVLGAVLPRAPVADLLLVAPAFHDPSRPLPVGEGCVVGSTSLRRQALLRLHDPAARPEMLRGNVPTRVNRCIEGRYGAVVMARAGFDRLALDPGPLAVYELSPSRWLPAPGQGAVAVQARAGDREVLDLLAAIDHPPTVRAVELERRLLANFGGGCHTAFGAHARPLGENRWRVDLGLEQDGWRQTALEGEYGDLLRRGPADIGHVETPPLAAPGELCLRIR